VVVWSEYGRISANDYRNYVYVKRWNGASWVSIGTFANTDPQLPSYYVSLTMDSSGNPVVAYEETSTIVVKRWNGSAWVEYGPTGISGAIRGVDIALDNTSKPVVAWTSKQFPTTLFVKHWNGSAWLEYGSGGMLNVSTDAGSQAGSISLAVDPLGTPIITWQESLNNSSVQVYVKRFVAGSWSFMGTNPLNLGLSQTGQSPSMALESSGNPVIVWTNVDPPISFTTNMKRWNGTDWVLHSRVSAPGFVSSLALDSSNTPVIALATNPNFPQSPELYATRFVSNGWQPLGSLDNTLSNTTRKSAITRTSTNLPVVAWEEINSTAPTYNIYVKQWPGTAWQNLGGALDNVIGKSATSPSIAMQTDNRPVVAWSEFMDFSVIPHFTYVKRWDGAAWVPVGTPFPTGFESFPVIALDTANTPYLAWRDYDAAQNLYRIKIAKLSGTNWVGITGAATPTTVFASANISSFSMALDSTGKPSVAAVTGTNNSLVVRQWNGAAWVALGSTVASAASDVSIAVLLSTGLPVVSYSALVGSDYSVYVKQWNATTNTWQSYGTTVDAAGTNGFTPQIKVGTNAIPYVVYEEKLGSARSVFVKRWLSGAWRTVDSKVDDDLFTTTSDSYPSLVLKTNNLPIVSWSEYAGPTNGLNNRYVKQY
jgi:hypothetical protein